MLQQALEHFLDNVLPAANDYEDAESALSEAYRAAGEDQSKCQSEMQRAKRRAAEVAIAIDGLADRAAKQLGVTPNAIRAQVSPLCIVDANLRTGCIGRVCAVANAYKHSELQDSKHPIKSHKDILIVLPGWGIDGYGLGKFSGIEVMVHETNGARRKFLGDVPYSIAGWVTFFKQHGAQLPPGELHVCGLCVGR